MFFIFSFYFCKPIIIRPVSPCSSLDSGPSYGILNLADVADVFVANFIPGGALPMLQIRQGPHSVVLNLPMLVSTLVSVAWIITSLASCIFILLFKYLLFMYLFLQIISRR